MLLAIVRRYDVYSFLFTIRGVELFCYLFICNTLDAHLVDFLQYGLFLDKLSANINTEEYRVSAWSDVYRVARPHFELELRNFLPLRR